MGALDRNLARRRAVLASRRAAAPVVALDPVAAYAFGFAMVVASALASALQCPRLSKRGLWLALVPARYWVAQVALGPD